MKEKPILFSGEMVRAILEDRKTQTRRIMKPQPWTHPDTCEVYLGENLLRDVLADRVGVCRYLPGDRLWVRETWRKFGHGANGQVEYRADYDDKPAPFISRSPIFMPRWASRIDLEITKIRIERLQKISAIDAHEEGIEGLIAPGYCYDISPTADFAKLWDKINGKRAPWESNPWVWVIEFRRVK
jgi:hypothetical protein